jgi:hypothetical protein
MSISNGDSEASTRSGANRRRNGRKCPRCKKFGTFGPNAIVCDRCLGVLPLIFDVTVTVTIGGDR